MSMVHRDLYILAEQRVGLTPEEKPEANTVFKLFVSDVLQTSSEPKWKTSKLGDMYGGGASTQGSVGFSLCMANGLDT